MRGTQHFRSGVASPVKKTGSSVSLFSHRLRLKPKEFPTCESRFNEQMLQLELIPCHLKSIEIFVQMESTTFSQYFKEYVKLSKKDMFT